MNAIVIIATRAIIIITRANTPLIVGIALVLSSTILVINKGGNLVSFSFFIQQTLHYDHYYNMCDYWICF